MDFELSLFWFGGTWGLARLTCFYPWKAWLSHNLLNSPKPGKGNGRGTNCSTVGFAKPWDVPARSKSFSCLLSALQTRFSLAL